MTTRKRKMVLTYDEDTVPPEPVKYADLAHAVWIAGQLAMPSGAFWVERDDHVSDADLNQRWNDLGTHVPWKPMD